jgi:Domain of unknown function (DUF1906)
MITVIDTNHDTIPHLAALKASGVSTIIRYLSPINPHGEKCVKAPEAKAIAAAGLRLGLVCEGWGDFAHGGISAGAGERDGAWCVDYAATLGAPAGAAIFYAVDTDASAAQIKRLVLPYFQSIRAKHQAAAIQYRIGVYGSGNLLTAVLGAGLADLDWLSCSLGWGGSRAYLANIKPALAQHTPKTLCGIDCDPDDAEGEFGEFVPSLVSAASDDGGVGPLPADATEPPPQIQPPTTPLLNGLLAEIGHLIGRPSA